ncbi:MAG: helix-turn-helix transcriptional regulator [Maritimibacter sp.]|uniref:helix-turn-helix domain-containing protein n=1 Tax=Maritimibacter sp. TaxID=2003363 RepID=UPI001D53DE12|nr:helix-turn-helix transcriptional regulator [Maritimibacter sp.]MBL6428051.1 helix-turn-helix transcriptional regulator [Maritimibacter sp.]
MAGAARSECYQAMLNALIATRKDRNLSQAKLAKKLGKPPSFVAKYELAERRLDVVEFLVVLSALDEDPLEFIQRQMTLVPTKL